MKNLIFIPFLVLFTIVAQAQKVNTKKKDSIPLKKDTISIFNKINELDEVVVLGKKVISRQLRQSPLSVETISLKPILSQGGAFTDVLDRISGVNLRTEGAIGDPVNFSINGLDKKAIVIFKDDVPVSFYGHDFNPTNLNTNMFERVDVYKGVLPLHLGADALGGGINFISRIPNKKELDISAEIASFNTQRYGLNLFLPNKKNTLYAGANVSYIASDNNWKIDIGSFNEKTDVFSDHIGGASNLKYDRKNMEKIKNNGANIYAGEFYIGAKNQKWADDLKITFINTWLHKRINHIGGMPLLRAADALFPFGRIKSYSGLISYKKKLLDKKLSIRFLQGYGKTNVIFKDTVQTVLDRHGGIKKIKFSKDLNIFDRRELFGSDLDVDYTNKLFRASAAYKIFPNHEISTHHIYTEYGREGTDSIGGRVFSIAEPGKMVDLYSFPATYQKSISSVGFNSNFFNKKLKSTLAYKIYKRRAKGYSTYKTLAATNKDAKQKSMEEKISEHEAFMAGISYKPTKNWLFKASYEQTVRLPDNEEIYGNSQWIRSNFSLNPETSKNFNVQAQYSSSKKGKGAWMVSSSFFYRKTRDIIILKIDIPFSYYINVPKIGLLIKGVDLDFVYRPLKFLTIGGNAMYLDRFLASDEETIEHRLWDYPPILANLNANLTWDDWFQKGSSIKFYWYWNYTHRYSIDPFRLNEDLGLFDDLDDANGKRGRIELGFVPYNKTGQNIHTAGVTYEFPNINLSISSECKNVTNNVIYYDLMEGPGRVFSLKLRWKPNL